MKRISSFVFVVLATWMVAACTDPPEEGGEATAESELLCGPSPTAPCAPVLSVGAVRYASPTTRRIPLSWQNGGGGAVQSYLLERKTDWPTATYSVVLHGGIGNLSFTDTVWPVGFYWRMRAQGANGEYSPYTPEILLDVKTCPSSTMSYRFIPVDAETEPGIVIGGSSAVLGKLELRALSPAGANGAADLAQTKLRVSLANPAAWANLSSLYLYDGATLVAGPVAPDTSGNADFSLNFAVPGNEARTLTIKGSLNQVGPGGAPSGANAQVMIDLTDPASGTFEYRNMCSNAVTQTISAADLIGSDKIVRKTKPTVSLAALPTSVLVNGTQTLSRFTVTADVGQQVSLKKIPFQVVLYNVGGVPLSIVNPAIREVGQGSDIPTSSFTDCNVFNGNPLCTVYLAFSSEQVIPPGTSKTYAFRMVVSGADTAGESVSTQLFGDRATVTGFLSGTDPNALGVNETPYGFIWSDNSAIPHNDSVGGSADWTNGRYVKHLPSDAQTMTR